MGLIKTTLITYVTEVPYSDIRDALIFEAAERHGLVHEGEIIPGVTGRVGFDGRRGKSGVYTVTLTRDPAKIGQAQIGGKVDG